MGTRPQNRGYSSPCVPGSDSRAVELDHRRMLGPIQTLVQELNSYYGGHWGKNHDNRLDASHDDGNAISKSKTGTNVAKNLNYQTWTPRHLRGH